MKQYCWYGGNSETVHGPFDTVEAAEADGRDYHDQDERATVYIAETKAVDPAEWAAKAIDLDDLLERMEDAIGDEVAFENQVFDPVDCDGVTAADALKAAIREWATKHISAGPYWYAGGDVVKTVTLPSEAGKEAAGR